MSMAGAETCASPLRQPPFNRLSPSTPVQSPMSSWYADTSERPRPVMSPLSPLQYRSTAVFTRRDDFTPRRASPIFAARGARVASGGVMSPRCAILTQRRYQVTPVEYSPCMPGSQRPKTHNGRAFSSTFFRGSTAGSSARHVGGHSGQPPLLDHAASARPLSAREHSFSVQRQQQRQQQEQQRQKLEQQRREQEQELQHFQQVATGQKFKGIRKDDDSLVTSSNDLSNTDDGFSSQTKTTSSRNLTIGPTKPTTVNPVWDATRSPVSPCRTPTLTEILPQQSVQKVATPAGRRPKTPDLYNSPHNSPSLASSGRGTPQGISLNSTLNREFPIHESLCITPYRKPVPTTSTLSMYSTVHSTVLHRSLNSDSAIKRGPQKPVTNAAFAAVVTKSAPSAAVTPSKTPTHGCTCSRSSTETSHMTSRVVVESPLPVMVKASFASSRVLLRQFVQRWRNHYEENKNAYSEGGYMTVTPGKKLNSRYVVVQKLGWGEFSTVWLAYDTMHMTHGKPHQAFVALKIAKCDSAVSVSTQYEINLLRYVGSQSSHEAPLTNLVDRFEVTGQYGSHVCMVMPLHGSNLLSIIDQLKANKCIRSSSEIYMIKEIIVSILMGLSELDKLDVIHTDIKPENVLCTTPDSKILDVIESFCRRNKERSSMVPHEKVREAMLQGDPNHLVCIADFGLSVAVKPSASAETLQGRKHCSFLDSLVGGKKEFPVEKAGTALNQRGTMIQTREYRAPEVLIGLDFNTRTDMWSVGCMVYELITGDFLVDPKRRTRNERMMDVEHLAMMMQLLGPVPEEIIRLRAGREGGRPPPRYIHRYFNESGRFIYADKYRLYPRRHLDRELELFLPPTEAKSAAAFIMACLSSYTPTGRPSAQAMIGHAWLAEVTGQQRC